MSEQWEVLAQRYGPQIAVYNAPEEPEEEEGEEREYTVRVDFVASKTVTITAKSREAALAEGFDEFLYPFGKDFEWEVVDTRMVEKDR